MQIELLLSINCQSFFSLYLQDDAQFGFDKYFQSKQELNISMGTWQDPSQEETQSVNVPVTRVKKCKADVQIKNNAFVKQAPTTKTFFLCEQTETNLLLRVTNKTTDVPYCDSFCVEEEWFLASLPGAKCCVLRITMGLVWYKSTMMKSIIQSNTVSESAKAWEMFKTWVYVTNGH